MNCDKHPDCVNGDCEDCRHEFTMKAIEQARDAERDAIVAWLTRHVNPRLVVACICDECNIARRIAANQHRRKP